jgi:hypothetical protein
MRASGGEWRCQCASEGKWPKVESRGSGGGGGGAKRWLFFVKRAHALFWFGNEINNTQHAAPSTREYPKPKADVLAACFL